MDGRIRGQYDRSGGRHGRMERQYPLIIIDDEPLARRAISTLLEDRFSDFPVAGEADSGPAGVELFRELRPAIIIMDIRIPGFNGLEASRIILKESPETQIIVLSAFDEFRFIQEALHDGVLGYLLKPVREERLAEQLAKAVDRIRRTEDQERDRDNARTFRGLAVREQVASFLYGRRSGISAAEFADLTDPPVTGGYFAVFRIEGDHSPDASVLRGVIDRLDGIESCLPGEWMGAYLPVFIRSDASEGEAWRSEADFLAKEIRHLIRVAAGRRVRSAVGPPKSDPETFPDSFRAAFDVLQEDAETAGTVFAGTGGAGTPNETPYPAEVEAAFLAACRASDAPAALAAAADLAEYLTAPSLSLMDARFAVTEFLIIFRREWERVSGESKRRPMANLLRDVLLCPDQGVLRDWFLLTVRDLVHNLGDAEEGEDFILRKVKHFIDLNDLRTVSLESAAESVGISAPYLSRLFKEKSGGHFHDYVVDRRLEAASRLLRETGKSVTDVAAAVGYGDVAYFGRIFRKRYGSSPREYRQGK